MRRWRVISSLITLLFFWVGCSKQSIDPQDVATPSSIECQRTRLEHEFIVHWKTGRPTLVREKDIKKFYKKNKSKIKLIEPNYSLQASSLNTLSPSFNMAHVSSVRDSVKTETAWRAGFLGQGMTIGIIDTGVAISHPTLRSRLAINQTELMRGSNSIDDDGNGFIDDIYGWNFVSDSPIQVDEIGHGTAMAGIITGLINQHRSIHMAPNAKILSADFMNEQGGTEYHAHAAIKYVLSRGVNIVNNSWSISCSELLKNDFNSFKDKNVIFVNASGNVPVDVFKRGIIPSSLSLPNVLNVGSVDDRGHISSFSGYGQTVNIFAPGESIPTIYPSSGWNGSSSASGTSISTAIVSGAAALIWSAFPEVKASDIVALIVEGAQKSFGSAKILDVRQSLILGKKRFGKNFPIDPIVIPVNPVRPVNPIEPNVPTDPFDPGRPPSLEDPPLPVDPFDPEEPDDPEDPGSGWF